MNLSITNFSYFNSYISISYDDNELYLKSLHGVSKGNMKSLKLIPSYNGKVVSYKYTADENLINIKTEYGNINICFFDSSRIIVEGIGEGLGVIIDSMPLYNFEYNYMLGTEENKYVIINSYKNLSKYMVYVLDGNIELFQDINYDSSGSTEKTDSISIIKINSLKENKFKFIIEDVPTHNTIPDYNKDYNFEKSLYNSRKNFEKFSNNFKLHKAEYSDSLKNALYILWSSTVGALGNLKHSAVYASINNFPGVWSWDNAFIAVGLSKINAELAFNQIKLVFEHQDDFGQLPGSVSDSTIRWNFCKPPVHGYILSKIIDNLNLSKEDILQVYNWIKKQVTYYIKYKDSNSNGIFEYFHGNDSGQDNSSIFRYQVPVNSPDLTAYIIKAMDFLADISEKLENGESGYWKDISKKTLDNFINYFFVDDRPVVKKSFNGEIVENKSIMPYISVILGNKLPENILNNIVSDIKEYYITDYGVATEALDSQFYEDDAYWRGPIWAPSTYLILEGLKDCGEYDLAINLAEKFCNMVKEKGFAENFDAKTGEGLRDKSFCWTASIFINYLSEI